MWFCPGANHAPHHCPKEYADRYKGKFDDGYEAYREWVLPRMIERGILPKGTQLTPINPLPEDVLPAADTVRPWNSLSAEEKSKLGLPPDGIASQVKYVSDFAKIRKTHDLRTGDIIYAVDGVERDEIANTAELYLKLRMKAGESATLGVIRSGQRIQMPLHSYQLSFRK